MKRIIEKKLKLILISHKKLNLNSGKEVSTGTHVRTSKGNKDKKSNWDNLKRGVKFLYLKPFSTPKVYLLIMFKNCKIWNISR